MSRFLLIVLLLFAATAAHAQLRKPITWQQGFADVVTRSGERHNFSIRFATTPETRSKGLSGVTEMAPNAGMIFVFDKPKRTKFWMRGTYIPLDMIFIDAEGIIVKIVTRRDLDSTKTTDSEIVVAAIMEINAGISQRLGIAPGDRVEYSWLEQY